MNKKQSTINKELNNIICSWKEDKKTEEKHIMKGHYILEEDGYKVVTMPFMTYEEAETSSHIIKEHCPDAFILKRPVNGEEDQFVKELLQCK